MLKGLELRRDVIETAQGLVRARLNSSTWGNISVRDPENGGFFITPSGMDYDKLTPEDIVLVDFDGRVIEGIRKPSTETPMHALFYRERPDIGAVVHTHSIYATTMAVLKKEIPPVIAELAAGVGGSVPVADYATFGTLELGASALKAMGNKRAVLLQNHGVVAMGNNLVEAGRLAAIVEDAAQIYYLAQVIGTPTMVPADELDKLYQAFQKGYGQK
ncbi:L-fuculose phosphate aldolase [Moorella thermoacetica]|uniref:L-fuculose phosphate aldolase n=1 Tax=Neomoorella thermoacetica TaxID=1525 RepID=A0A1J5JF32_NEOTH|nr:class II aldolase/adducin family protein [Moorella thermoacetica]OIQ08142.1 L-fuculose phosphate aldolase [Moorella thermoacetica]